MKPCMIIWPANVPTAELEIPDAMREITGKESCRLAAARRPLPTGAAHTGQRERRCSRRTRAAAAAVGPEPNGAMGARIEKAQLSGSD